MANTYKILGQSNPAAATLTAAYTVPAATQVIVSTITVCNRSATPTAFRLAIEPNGTADNATYLAYDTPIGGNQTIWFTKAGITMDATDEVQVYATLATLSFNVFGIEIT